MDPIIVRRHSVRRPTTELLFWGVLVVAWFVVLCAVPDPRPLGAPEWAVKSLVSLLQMSEPTARASATVLLRGIGLAVFGMLLALSVAPWRLRTTGPVVLVLAPLLAIATQWINYGYFPITAQLQLGVSSAVLGALAGFTLRRSRMALVGLVVVAVGLYVWGTSTGISDDLYEVASATAIHILEDIDDIPDGDEGFAQLLRSAFTFAADNSHSTDAVLPNQAAILALGVILGEERVAEVAKRPIDLTRKDEFEAIRNRVTLRERHDLARHFWVSAALTILSDESRSMTVGIAKEMMDATPGGSGFSFVDLTADRAGTLFATAATRDADAARNMQARIRREVVISDYCPEVQDLPEGLTREEFQAGFGGLGGTQTEQLVNEIHRRLATCAALEFEP